jgi:dUTP pyrophosphatase
MLDVKVKIVKTDAKAKLPTRATAGAAAYDFYACENCTIPPKARRIVSTGLKMEIPEGWQLRLSLRSGTALKTPLILANAPGIIDSDYRGVVGLILFNTGDESALIACGDRLVQGVFVEAPTVTLVECTEDDLSKTDRAEGGFGSTGERHGRDT